MQGIASEIKAEVLPETLPPRRQKPFFTHHRRGVLLGYAFALPCIIGVLIFYGIPFVISVVYCFTKGVGKLEFNGIMNFADLFSSGSFKLAAVNTLRFMVVSIPLALIISLFFALVLNNRLKGVSYFRSFFIMPLVIPVASIIMFWNMIFGSNGVLNGLIKLFGLSPQDWILSGNAFWVLVLLFLWKNCGYNVVLFLAALNNIPKNYYEAAVIDGASKRQLFTHITLPFIAAPGFFIFTVTIVNSLKVFREAYLLAGSYPSTTIYLLQHFMNNNFMDLNYQRLSTASLIMVVFISILIFFLLKFGKKFEER